jgi:hypothetical protein
MDICWLRIFLHRLTDQELALEVHRVGLEGIRTDELEALLRKYDLLDKPALFFFQPAASGIGTDGSMHHLADRGHAQLGAKEMTALQVVAEMRKSDKRLGSGKCEGGFVGRSPSKPCAKQRKKKVWTGVQEA